MAAPLNPIDACPRGGFFDGNDDFGGMPFRFLMAMLVASPLIYMAGSGSFWIWCEYRRRSLMNPNSSNNNNSSSYRSMDGSPSSLPLSASSSSASSSSSCNEEEPTSPITSSSIAPIDCASPSADSASSIANPFLRARSAHTEYITRLRSIISTMSYRYRILMICRLLTRSTTLFKSSLFISCINILINISAIFYSLIEKERCCLGGTGALYSLLCLRICISYLSIRISHWQTNSDSYIPVSDKSCNIGFSIHMLWLSIAFLIATPGDCSLNARIMYGVCCFNILSILVQLIGVVIMSVCIKYCQSSEGGNGGLIIIVCRCILKHLLCGWAYGGPLDQPDPATGIEIEIECLPCIPYGPNVTELVEPLRNMREEERNEMSENKKAKRVNDLSYHGDMAADGVSRSSCDDDHKAVTDTFSACPTTVVDVNGSLDSSNSNVDRSRCEAGLSCAICLNNYELNEMIRPLPCGHHFHKDCTDTWLRVRSTCPLCVRSVLLL